MEFVLINGMKLLHFRHRNHQSESPNPTQALRNALFERFEEADGVGGLDVKGVIVDALDYLRLSEHERDAKERAAIERAAQREANEAMLKQYEHQFPC